MPTFETLPRFTAGPASSAAGGSVLQFEPCRAVAPVRPGQGRDRGCAVPLVKRSLA